MIGIVVLLGTCRRGTGEAYRRLYERVRRFFIMKCKNYDETDEVCKTCNANGVENQQSCFSSGGDKIHPDHYKLDGGREVIDVIKMMLTEEELRGFCKGNYIKYYMRAGKKSGESAADDLKKAEWYFRYLEQLDFFKYLDHAEKVDTLGKFEIR